MQRTIFTDDHHAFRDVVRQFIAKEIVPNLPDWEAAGCIPRDFYTKTAALGINGLQVPEQYGGGGIDTFLFNTVVYEEIGYAAASLGGFQVHLNTVLPYFLEYANEEQRDRWFPGFADGALVSAIAMTEPGIGSDLAGVTTTAVRDGDDYVLNGNKTFITGGINADLVIVVARTSKDPENRRNGLSLLVVESGMPGFTRGRNLHKIGMKSSDTAELTFDNVRVPAANLLGEEGAAFKMLAHNLPQERLSIAITAQATATAAVDLAIEYAKERMVFGKPLAGFQNTKFVLAECATELQAGQALIDQALIALDAGTLTPADAAKVKLFCTEVQARVIDKCLQVHGGYGYMTEYPIARLYADARVTRIFGGTSEVMKSVISKSMGL
ncbi:MULTISPECIES: acyl-CoA dehydrogenase family protein [Rhodococcus]|uniref:Acyl-[acyl-carrier-protein] dehydrogenase MbtN n=1 Tax=Rhodococcus opacus TaxID=37919 RepID=A0AAX3YEW7_RHOOP|nr:acyl-CoA dehydrogenase family protein [Rhodococcus opacus]NHU41907.1 acyl-CoA dehydrogenase [Rhodococcus sp. A14]MCZ4586728.1 acyl-CoA dehydrogenase family protein [Rhodococcus opacus]MDV6243537.1 acyl-CoA dehydrogenase family protein [Rhodococcus opacus]RKM74666.1 acyl-CoA dehydrogenase [Rhodococcus opacus]WKN55131.1 acyl-CoA dehydrogenase family protein [Rhodococcus opacus]